MTFYGGGELTRPDYEGGSFLLMPTLTYDEWGSLDWNSTKAVIAALRVAGSIVANRRVPYLSQVCAAVFTQIRTVQIEAAESAVAAPVTRSADPGAGAQKLARKMKVFPRGLRGMPERAVPAKEKTIWELYGYGQEVFEEMERSAVPGPGSYEGMPDLDLNADIAKRLFDEFERLRFRDWSDTPTPDIGKEGDRRVDFGCDMKLLLTALSAVGPVHCEIGADDEFAKLTGGGTQPPPGQNVRALVPTPAAKTPKEEYVVVVACRPRGELETQLGKGGKSLRDIAVTLEREHRPFEAQYLLRRIDERGKTKETWGDGGYAWMEHADLRRVLRWARMKVPESFLGSSRAS
jgi:hypothetical protein